MRGKKSSFGRSPWPDMNCRKMLYILKKRLDKQGLRRYNQSCYGRLAQLVEHALDVRRVSGSSPLSSTNGVDKFR